MLFVLGALVVLAAVGLADTYLVPWYADGATTGGRLTTAELGVLLRGEYSLHPTRWPWAGRIWLRPGPVAVTKLLWAVGPLTVRRVSRHQDGIRATIAGVLRGSIVGQVPTWVEGNGAADVSVQKHPSSARRKSSKEARAAGKARKENPSLKSIGFLLNTASNIIANAIWPIIQPWISMAWDKLTWLVRAAWEGATRLAR